MHLVGLELTKQKTIKYCPDPTCNNLIPICCLFINAECSDNGAKWYHMSAGEHICSVCYNHLHSFFSYETENSEISNWKQTWLGQSQETPTINDYIASTLLSNWYQCNECNKWRQCNRDITLSPMEINNFSCNVLLPTEFNPCSFPEDQRIDFIRNHPASFFESIKYTVYLGTTPYLNVYDEYSLDTVGISPIAVEPIDFGIGDCCEGFMRAVFNPFSKETNTQTTPGSIDPTGMDKWEYEFFPTFSGGNMRNIFIGLRNLMLLLWATDPKRAVTANLLMKCVSIRGIVKVALLVNSIPDLIKIYSGFGYINFGFPVDGLSMINAILLDHPKRDVVIIGAGLSGLAAARHLSLVGANVTVLESTKSLIENNKCVSLKLKSFDCLNEIYGSINNPFSFMAYQCGIETREVSTNLSIFDEDGSIISDEVDQFYQNLVYNFVAYLMNGASIIKHSSQFDGCSVADLYRNYRRDRIIDNSEFAANEGVESIYLSEIEYRVFGGAAMETVPRDVDMCTVARGMSNFYCKQFSGSTMEPVDGWSKLFTRLVDNLDIRYETRAESIGKQGEKCVVRASNGQEFKADKVLLATTPWNAVRIKSDPDWLENRDIITSSSVADADQIRAGAAFTIIQMAFTQQNLFWRSKIPPSSSERTFAIVTKSPEMRGFCHLFKESHVVDGFTILQTRIFGLAARACEELSEEEIIGRVLEKLSCLASGDDLTSGPPPRPSWYQIIKIENASLACTEIGNTFNKLAISNQFQSDVFVTNKTMLAEPINLSNSFCVGMEAASLVLKTIL